MSAANALAAARAVAVLPIAWAIASDQRAVALAVFVVAAVSDAIDGWLARRRLASLAAQGHAPAGRLASLGALVDPLADKVLVVGTLAALAAVGAGWPVTILAVLVGAREVLVATLRVRAFARGAALPAPRSAKAKTALEMGGVALVVLDGRPWSVVGAGLVGLALVLSIVTLPRYLAARFP